MFFSRAEKLLNAKSQDDLLVWRYQLPAQAFIVIAISISSSLSRSWIRFIDRAASAAKTYRYVYVFVIIPSFWRRFTISDKHLVVGMQFESCRVVRGAKV